MARVVVRWTSREYREVAAWFVDHQYSPKDRGLKRLINEAQESLLPPDRRRPFTWVDMTTRRRLIAEWEALRAQPDPQPVIADPVTPEPPTLEAFTLEDLLVEVARRVARGFENITRPLQESTPRQTVADPDPPPKHNPFMASPAKQVAPEILVVGTYGPQEACLRDMFDNVELVFVGSDEGAAAVSRKGKGVDHAFILTKFISHAQFDHVKKLPCEYTMVNGGMTELKERMREYIRT